MVQIEKLGSGAATTTTNPRHRGSIMQAQKHVNTCLTPERNIVHIRILEKCLIDSWKYVLGMEI